MPINIDSIIADLIIGKLMGGVIPKRDLRSKTGMLEVEKGYPEVLAE